MAVALRPNEQSQSRRATSTATAARRKAVGLQESRFHSARPCLCARGINTDALQGRRSNELPSLFAQEFQGAAHVADARFGLHRVRALSQRDKEGLDLVVYDAFGFRNIPIKLSNRVRMGSCGGHSGKLRPRCS